VRPPTDSVVRKFANLFVWRQLLAPNSVPIAHFLRRGSLIRVFLLASREHYLFTWGLPNEL